MKRQTFKSMVMEVENFGDGSSAEIIYWLLLKVVVKFYSI